MYGEIRKQVMWIAPLVAIASLLMVSVALAQSGADYSLPWWTVDGGGVTNRTQGGYTLGGTAGQPDALVWSDGSYVLSGGFWEGGFAAGADYRVYLPLVLRNYP